RRWACGGASLWARRRPAVRYGRPLQRPATPADGGQRPVAFLVGHTVRLQDDDLGRALAAGVAPGPVELVVRDHQSHGRVGTAVRVRDVRLVVERIDSGRVLAGPVVGPLRS